MSAPPPSDLNAFLDRLPGWVRHPESAWPEFLQELTRLMGADRAALFLLDPLNPSRVRQVTTHNLSRGYGERVLHLLPHLPGGSLLRSTTYRISVWNHIPGHPDASDTLKQLAREEGYTSAILVPLAFDGHRLGALTLYKDDGTFSPVDMEMLHLVAREFSILYHLIHADNLRRKQLLLLENTRQISRKIVTGEFTLRAGLKEILHVLRLLLTYERAFLLNADNDGRQVLASIPDTGESVALTGPLPVELLHGNGDRLPEILRPLQPFYDKIPSPRSWGLFPLESHRRTLGHLLIFRGETPHFSPGELEVLERFASQLSMFLSNVYLVLDIKRELEIQETLFRLSQKLRHQSTVHEVSRETLQEVMTFYHATEGLILLRTPRGWKIEANAGPAVEKDTLLEDPGGKLLRLLGDPPHPVLLSPDAFPVSLQEHLHSPYPHLAVPIHNTHHGLIGMLVVDLHPTMASTPTVDTLARLATELAGTILERLFAEEHILKTYQETLDLLLEALSAREHGTAEHTDRVTRWAMILGQEMGLNEDEMHILYWGALLHDIGKIGVPDSILQKPTSLTEEEWAWMRQHPEIGARILTRSHFLKSALDVVQHHHERWDGQGYPDGLKGTEIPRLARIFSVVDAFDAMTSDRPYRKALSTEEALKELERNRGTQFDPDVVDVFVRLVRERPEILKETRITPPAGGALKKFFRRI